MKLSTYTIALLLATCTSATTLHQMNAGSDDKAKNPKEEAWKSVYKKDSMVDTPSRQRQMRAEAEERARAAAKAQVAGKAGGEGAKAPEAQQREAKLIPAPAKPAGDASKEPAK